MNIVDLHSHSSASDGELAPAELVALAVEEGVSVLALTDHDTVAGVPQFLAAAAAAPLRAIPGLEISALHAGPGVLHILIYGPDPAAPELTDLLTAMVESRRQRGPRMLALLAELGIDITWDEVQAEAGGPIVSKAHVASLMVAKGYVADCAEAYNKYLLWGRPAYVDRLKWPSADCIEAAVASGGIPVLAHPGFLENNRLRQLQQLADLAAGNTAESPSSLKGGQDLARQAVDYVEQLVASLAGQGLRGIEAYYPHHTSEQTERFLALARQHDLLVTGGSDFHGQRIKPDVRLGRGLGSGWRVPPQLADILLAELDKPRG